MAFAKHAKLWHVAASLGLLGLGLGCSRPGGPGLTSEFRDGSSVGFPGTCLPILSAEPLPARSVVTNPDAGTSSGGVYFTSELFQQFDTFCGSCHVESNAGGFVVSKTTFAQQVTQAVIDSRVEIDDPDPINGYMPPANSGGKPWSSRLTDPNDPIVALVELLELWIQQGSPAVSFSLTPAGDGGTPDADAGLAPAGGVPDGGAGQPPGPSVQADYSLPPELGAGLTNIGTCVPNQYAVGINGQTMDQLDAFFAAATALPETLAATDLTTLDSDTLARNGVVSYLPAYPLWSDDAGKMRYVRPPHNQPIVFDKSTQQFQIPPNTRFYKTFLKKITQADGSQAWKKIETRLILSRPDQTLPDGTISQTALFGTYLWDDNEATAFLSRDPLHDGLPFADQLLTYVVDEPRAQAIQDSHPPDLEYALDVEHPGVRRHYGVPGSNRCVQCHMGSPSASFVLGFTPLQVATVPPGTSGVIEPATGDELTQLRRLISYGVISGMTSPSDVTPLEKSQLPRTPRNSFELTAQAYMLGNCAHCHNPRGFPSIKAPELKDVLNFLPGPNGGIFQFPLDKFSPLRARGPEQEIPIPYITPSLRDRPAVNENFQPGYFECNGETDVGGWCVNLKAGQTVDFDSAPWRSLIYRNVDTPFDYVDDYTIFPHMPMNTPGYDCRVTQIMGDWMVSIPAARVAPNISEDEIDSSGDTSPQPYVEVRPGDAGYAKAQSDAKTRLASYHASHRYNFCPDTSDIVDPAVLDGEQQTPADIPIYDASGTQQIMYQDGVPNRAHWVLTDLTDPPGDWLPRGSGWEAALVQHMADATGSGVSAADLQTVVDNLDSVSLTDDVKSALLTEVPFGLWEQKDGCDFSGISRADSFQGDARPYWMGLLTSADSSAPVYTESPGAAVFTNICINCHGPQADAKGLLADEIALLTGGNARVANFRTGLFGPIASPGMNRLTVFGPSIPSVDLPAQPTSDDVQRLADDFGARYMSWMALGGTKIQLPPNLLQLVALTPVLGQPRLRTDSRASANMLQLAQELCANVLPSSEVNLSADLTSQPLDWMANQTALIATNGDAELWLKLCSLNNRPVVRVLNPDPGWLAAPPVKLRLGYDALYWGTAPAGAAPDGGVPADVPADIPYPADSPVMDQRGQITMGIQADNLLPLCVQEPAQGSPEHAAADAYLDSMAASAGAARIPYCPQQLLAQTSTTDTDGNLVIVKKWGLAVGRSTDGNNTPVFTDANKWAIRGAINAGVAVFLYIDQLAKGNLTPKPLYNQCELLNNPGGN